MALDTLIDWCKNSVQEVYNIYWGYTEYSVFKCFPILQLLLIIFSFTFSFISYTRLALSDYSCELVFSYDTQGISSFCRFLSYSWTNLDFTSQSTHQNFHYSPKTIIIVRWYIIPLDHLTYSSNIHTNMEVIKLMYPYYSSLVSENHIFPFTLQVMTSELTELQAAARVWSLFNNIFMFICAPPTTMGIVSPKQTITLLRHFENQKPASLYCHDENHSMYVFVPFNRTCLFILKFPQNLCPNYVLMEAKTS